MYRAIIERSSLAHVGYRNAMAMSDIENPSLKLSHKFFEKCFHFLTFCASALSATCDNYLLKRSKCLLFLPDVSHQERIEVSTGTSPVMMRVPSENSSNKGPGMNHPISTMNPIGITNAHPVRELIGGEADGSWSWASSEGRPNAIRLNWLNNPAKITTSNTINKRVPPNNLIECRQIRLKTH